jgi:hypothetical protein
VTDAHAHQVAGQFEDVDIVATGERIHRAASFSQAEAQLEAVVAESLRHHAVVQHHDGPLDQRADIPSAAASTRHR